MHKLIGGVADRLLSLVAPKTTAAACPCNDVWIQYRCLGIQHQYRQCRSNCNCTADVCGAWFNDGGC